MPDGERRLADDDSSDCGGDLRFLAWALDLSPARYCKGARMLPGAVIF